MIVFIYYGSFVLNAVLIASTAYYWRKSRIQKARPESYELQEFMEDLIRGGSLIQVKRIAPSEALIHTRYKR